MKRELIFPQQSTINKNNQKFMINWFNKINAIELELDDLAEQLKKAKDDIQLEELCGIIKNKVKKAKHYYEIILGVIHFYCSEKINDAFNIFKSFSKMMIDIVEIGSVAQETKITLVRKKQRMQALEQSAMTNIDSLVRIAMDSVKNELLQQNQQLTPENAKNIADTIEQTLANGLYKSEQESLLKRKHDAIIIHYLELMRDWDNLFHANQDLLKENETEKQINDLNKKKLTEAENLIQDLTLEHEQFVKERSQLDEQLKDKDELLNAQESLIQRLEDETMTFSTKTSSQPDKNYYFFNQNSLEEESPLLSNSKRDEKKNSSSARRSGCF